MKLARSAPDLLREEIHRMVDAVWTTHFPIREPVDLAFHLGVLLCEIERYEAALPFFHESAALYSPNPATVFNLGLCLFHQGDLEAARACVEKAIEEAPDYAPAAALREEIAAALAAR
jgi:tetratricopeptide (TPR) repeat protein